MKELPCIKQFVLGQRLKTIITMTNNLTFLKIEHFTSKLESQPLSLLTLVYCLTSLVSWVYKKTEVSIKLTRTVSQITKDTPHPAQIIVSLKLSPFASFRLVLSSFMHRSYTTTF